MSFSGGSLKILVWTVIGTVVGGLVLLWVQGKWQPPLDVFTETLPIWSQNASHLLTSSLQVPVWAMLIIVASFPTAICLTIFLIKQLTDWQNAPITYCQDEIEALQWRWNWNRIGTNTVEIGNLNAYCPDCDARLLQWNHEIQFYNHETLFICERCPSGQTTGSHHEALRRLQIPCGQGKLIGNKPGEPETVLHRIMREIDHRWRHRPPHEK